MLQHLGMIGVSWRGQRAENLAGFTLNEDTKREQLIQFANDLGLSEFAYIATCNRVELIFVRSGPQSGEDLRPQVLRLLGGGKFDPQQARRILNAWQGEGVAERMFSVASGLDSASLGETEIVGQMRAAHDFAKELGSCGPLLDFLFTQSYAVAAKVRENTKIGAGRVSLAEIAVDLATQETTDINGPITLLGVSPMTERAAVSLQKAKIPMVIVNRTVEKAAALAASTNATVQSIDDFKRSPHKTRAIISATGSPEPIIDHPTLEKLLAACDPIEQPMLIDMAIPPDIDPHACMSLEVKRHGMDDIVSLAEQNRGARENRVASARTIIDDALNELNQQFVERSYGPLLGTLQKRYQHTAEEGVKRLLKKDLKNLNTEETEAVTRWATALARRFAHIPSSGLRGLINTGPEGSVEAFIDGLDDEIAHELRQNINLT